MNKQLMLSLDDCTELYYLVKRINSVNPVHYLLINYLFNRILVDRFQPCLLFNLTIRANTCT